MAARFPRVGAARREGACPARADDGRLNRLTRAPAAAGDRVGAVSTSETPATRIGRYEILRELGRGAMGVVFLARDPRVDRLVAIKTLESAGGTDPELARELKERFLNEARAAGRLNHPGVVAVLDADEDAVTGRAYLVMEYVEGTELRALLPSRLASVRIADIIDDIAAALEHAHARGVIHRDVKPANVIVDGSGRCKLTDFGVARLGDSTMTKAGQLLGSPAYMAPEQIRGKQVTPATDLFSLAVLAYEALTGLRPFRGDDLVSTTHAILHEEPEPPSRVRSALAPAVDAVFRRALAKQPEERHPSAGAFSRALRGALLDVGETIAVPPAGAIAPPPARFPRRVMVLAVAALLLLLVGAVALKLRIPDPPPGAPAPAVVPGPGDASPDVGRGRGANERRNDPGSRGKKKK